VAILLSAVAAYLTFFLFLWFTRDLDELEALSKGNVAVGIVLGAILVSVAIVLRPALVVHTESWDVGTSIFFRALLAEALQLAVGLVLAAVTIALSLALFAALTRNLDEVEELKNGNVAIAWVLAGVAISVSLMISQGVAQIMSLVSGALY
jgi:uncharacterized membrane protein YjfL (UPF0719 family)